MSDQGQDNPERPHVTDGIREYDNPLPRWWLGLFIFCIIYGLIYLLYFHIGDGTSLEENMNADMIAVKARTQTESPEGSEEGSPSGEDQASLAKHMQDESVIAAGKVHYDTYCSPCHRPDLGGLIGPNLVDDHWLHGCTPEAIMKVVDEGVPEKGMASWGPILGKKKITEVVAYILSMQGSEPPEPKEKQGVRCP
ncbi:MAG: c-type cytochrome [Deltaproteobacteria bacterium]|nr:c-type cytochrome [Deltaproteobacteria bacterium]